MDASGWPEAQLVYVTALPSAQIQLFSVTTSESPMSVMLPAPAVKAYAPAFCTALEIVARWPPALLQTASAEGASVRPV